MSFKMPKHHQNMKERFPEYMDALSDLGKSVRSCGPLDEKTAQLIQLAASTAKRSEGGVHSHARRAIENGASPEEIYQTLLLLTSTIGFPTVAAAISWVDDVIEDSM
ncbi:MAG: carboxymuconolactone decarboxylase family protein [Methanobacteriaceae archaeon]|nr:carboxymuconolactone decarboxylase family protein [Methanobacteriaceae archaeon]